ncbi:Protein CBG08273 [Caenorhabditis briggsae]|uniref:Protein CBG08273 n=1 Tax=Caenorhabditis briggsae TaxID=6238 RepID=A8X669_CAEBR|nr:Protein CBG08273 [Caenorhabditis briggsae]CAP28130.1 Protein CBG08273 [Caenorhabditis briggsae]
MKNKKNKNKSGNRRSRSSQPPKKEVPEEKSETEIVPELPPPTDVTEINEEVTENTDLPLVTSEKVDVSSQEPVVVDEEKQKENELDKSKTEQVEEAIQEIEQEEKVDVENLEDKEEEEHVDELEVAEEGAEEGNDSVDSGNSQKRTQSDDETSVAVSEPEVWTNYDYDRKAEEYDVDQIIFWKSYRKKYSAVLRFVDPEFRYIAEIGPSATFDSEGVDKMIAKMEELGIQNAWPFDTNFTATTKELRQFLSEVLDKIKFCLRLACAERGYKFKSGNSNFAPISSVWGEEIDPILELKTLKVIVDKMKEPLMRDEAEGQEARFWAETANIFQFVMPALEIFDSKTLSENSISDCMSSIHGRKDLGFEISEKEVDEMLERSFNESGFGEFPPTALFAPEVFKTVNQLKMIFNQIEQMSKVVDVRVKLSAIQMITRIFEQISDDDAVSVLEEYKGQNPVTIEKMFGIDPHKFEINRDSKRTQYLKLFFTILGENPKEEFEFSTERLTAAFKCLYLVFDPFEVNMILFKIIGTRIRENHILDKDRKKLIDVLLILPEFLIKRLEIGPKFINGEVSDDNQVSMYFQLMTVLKNGNKDQIDKFGNFVAFAANSDKTAILVSATKAFRMVMKCVETGTCRTMAIEVLKSLAYRCSSFLPNEFYEDLIIFALSKYSFPDEKPVESKYQFIDIVFNVINQHKDALEEVLKGPSLKEKWTDMGHHWYTVLYLTHKFPVLKDATPVPPQYPWLSAGGWTGEEQDKTELKNYVFLAKVPTAWPNCTDMKIVEDLVSVDKFLMFFTEKIYVLKVDGFLLDRAVQNGGRASAGLEKASAEEKKPRRAPLRKSLARPRPAEAGLANVTTVRKSHILRQQITHFSRVFSIFPSICGDMNISNGSVEHVPPDVSRSDLYTAMRKYVSEFTIKEEWKKKLLNSFDSKIGFLTSHIKKEPQQEETSEKPTPELKQDVLQNVVETSDAVTVPVEKVEEEAEKVGPESIGSENEEKKIEPGNETDENNVKTEELNDKGNKEDPTPDDTTCEVADKKLESFENNVQESKTEDAGTDTEQKKEESYVNLKPLRDVGRVHEFCKRYTDNEWERMPHVVQDEVMRQRKFYGFSNKVNMALNSKMLFDICLFRLLLFSCHIFHNSHHKTEMVGVTYTDHAKESGDSPKVKSQGESPGTFTDYKTCRQPNYRNNKHSYMQRENTDRKPTNYTKRNHIRKEEPVCNQELMPLSDDAFTAVYEPRVWQGLPREAKEEIMKQRRLKLDRTNPGDTQKRETRKRETQKRKTRKGRKYAIAYRNPPFRCKKLGYFSVNL